METALPYLQIILAVLLIAGILLQQSGASVGAALGGDSTGVGFNTRRGAEKVIFNATLVIAVLFVAAAVTALVI